jgi:hypothetical protein
MTQLFPSGTEANLLFRVRAAYSTPAHEYKLYPRFLTSTQPVEDGITSALPIFHVMSDNFVPTLLPHEFEQINNTCEQDQYTAKNQAAPSEFAAARAQALGPKQDRPDVSGAFERGHSRQCAACEKVPKNRDLRLYSRTVPAASLIGPLCLRVC